MSELSDLALLGICAVALFVIYLLRVIWEWERFNVRMRRELKLRIKQHPQRPKRTKKPASGAKIGVIVDGSNVLHWGGEPSLLVLRRVIESLRSKGFAPHVIFDANVGYLLGDHYLDDQPMAKLLGLKFGHVLVVEKGVTADERILAVATEQNVRVVSNDQFRDWSVQFPIVRKKGRIIRGTWQDGSVVWQGI